MAWVHRHIFAAGGDHIPRNWRSFCDQTAIGAVVHLNPGNAMPFVGPLPASFLWLDLADERAADSATRWLAGRFVQEQLAAGRSVLLHSGEGRHRTRWIFVSYLLLQGRSLGAAIRQAEEQPWLAPYETDREAWRAYLDWMGAEGKGSG